MTAQVGARDGRPRLLAVGTRCCRVALLVKFAAMLSNKSIVATIDPAQLVLRPALEDLLPQDYHVQMASVECWSVRTRKSGV